MLKIKRWLYLQLVCRFVGHKSKYNIRHHNGYVKGTAHTNNPKALYQKKCDRCNRFYGTKSL